MNQYDTDTLRLLTRERHELRLRQAEAERLARELRGSRQKRHLPHLNMHQAPLVVARSPSTEPAEVAKGSLRRPFTPSAS